MTIKIQKKTYLDWKKTAECCYIYSYIVQELESYFHFLDNHQKWIPHMISHYNKTVYNFLYMVLEPRLDRRDLTPNQINS